VKRIIRHLLYIFVLIHEILIAPPGSHYITSRGIYRHVKKIICHLSYIFLLIHEILIANVGLHPGFLQCIFAESSHSQTRHIPVTVKRGKTTFSAPKFPARS